MKFWHGGWDSNSRHAVLETAALPTELPPYFGLKNPARNPFEKTGGANQTNAGNITLGFPRVKLFSLKRFLPKYF